MRTKLQTKLRALIALLVGLHLVLLFPGFVAPYDPTAQDRELPYAPPTPLHFKDASGLHLRPFVYRLTPVLEGDQAGSYQEDRTKAYPVRLFVRGPSYRVLGLHEATVHLFGVAEPARILIFGTMATDAMNFLAFYSAARFLSRRGLRQPSLLCWLAAF